jgi:hypothetical protein
MASTTHFPILMEASIQDQGVTGLVSPEASLLDLLMATLMCSHKLFSQCPHGSGVIVCPNSHNIIEIWRLDFIV